MLICAFVFANVCLFSYTVAQFSPYYNLSLHRKISLLFQPVVRIYDIPDNTFESDEDEDSDESDEDESDDDDDDGKMFFFSTPDKVRKFYPKHNVCLCCHVFLFSIGFTRY